MQAVTTTQIIQPPLVAVDRESYAVSSHEYNFTVIGEVNDLLGVKTADVYWQLNAPLLQCPLDAGVGTQ